MWFIDSIRNGIIHLAENNRKVYKQQLQRALEEIIDPMAKEINWLPLVVRWWASFTTHVLVMGPKGNLEFHPSTFVRILLGIFFAMGFYIDIIILLFDRSSIITLLKSIAFMFIGYFLYRYLYRPIVFDKQSGYFYRGTPRLVYGLIDPNNTNIIPLSLVHAIQIIWKIVSSDSLFQSYEINLILKDKKRIHIIDHWNRMKIQEDAAKLAEYIWVPVWDISEVLYKIN